MKSPWTKSVALALCLCVCCAPVHANDTESPSATTYRPLNTRLSEQLVMERLSGINLPMEVRYDAILRSRIRSYIIEGSRDAEYMLGRTAIYFPVFEHYLRIHNLPEALKYLPLVESTLLPRSVSPAGAAGLWQFVPATARAMGLTVNGKIDERLDTYRATEAAVKMLATLYEEFQDWGLVLAAYNAGPGRVRQAIRASGSRNFWGARAYLPRESQRYVPAFIAAAYLVNYHQEHGLQPASIDYDLRNTRVFKVHQQLTISQIADAINVNYLTLRKLNQGYRQGIIPASDRGNYIVVPTQASDAFQAVFLGLAPNFELQLPNFTATKYVTVPGDKIEILAQLFRCSIDDLIRWNRLTKAEITVNQPLLIMLPKAKARP